MMGPRAATAGWGMSWPDLTPVWPIERDYCLVVIHVVLRLEGAEDVRGCCFRLVVDAVAKSL